MPEIQCSFCGCMLPTSAKFCKSCGKPQQLLPASHPQPSAADTQSQNSVDNSAPQLPPQNSVNHQPPSVLLQQFNQSAQRGGITAGDRQAPPQNRNYYVPPYGINREMKRGLAIASLVTGIIALLFSLVIVGAVFAVAGLILGIVAIVRANSEPRVYGGKGLAKGGIATSGLAVVFAVMILFVALPKLGGHRLTGARWQRYEIGDKNMSLELPSVPKKLVMPQLDNLPPDVRGNITLAELQESEYRDFVVAVAVIGYSDKIAYDNQGGVSGMIAEIRRRPEVSDVEYNTSVIGDSMLSVSGTMKVYGQPTILTGFVENHNHKMYAVMTFYAKSNKDAPEAAQRVFKSINLR